MKKWFFVKAISRIKFVKMISMKNSFWMSVVCKLLLLNIWAGWQLSHSKIERAIFFVYLILLLLWVVSRQKSVENSIKYVEVVHTTSKFTILFRRKKNQLRIMRWYYSNYQINTLINIYRSSIHSIVLLKIPQTMRRKKGRHVPKIL